MSNTDRTFNVPDLLEETGSFTDNERDALTSELLKIKTNPYTSYTDFKNEVWKFLKEEKFPTWFTDILLSRREAAWFENPVLLVKNAPIDPERPVFDYEEPVESKYKLKKTWVAEAFLEAIGELSGTPPIAYAAVNNGDVFQDIYPKRELAGGLSQKSTTTLPFHRDIFDENVPVEHIYMLGMRSASPNRVYTTYVSNKAIVDSLSDDERRVAMQPRFTTSFDDMKYTDDEKVDHASLHSILSPRYRLHYFENRTRGVDAEADKVASKISQRAHEMKVGVAVDEGDLVLASNSYCLHSREVVEVCDDTAMQQRWIVKTVNVDSLSAHARWMDSERHYEVSGGWRP